MKEGWTYKKLGEVCDIYNGNSINADYKKKHFYGAEGGLPFIATKDVSTIGTIDYNNGVRIPNYEEYKIAPANSVFICAEGGSAGKKFAYVERDVCFGNKLFCLNPKTDLLFGKYVYYYIQSDYFRIQFYSLLTGLIGGVSAKKFQTIEIPVPFLSEQRSIVSRLDSAFAHMDALKANAEKQLAEARQLFQAELAECMRSKEGWEEKPLKEISKYSIGLTYKPSDVNDNGTIVLRSSNIQNDKINLSDIVRVSCPIKEALYVQEGDILMCSRNGSAKLVGKVAIIPEATERMSYGTFMMIIRSDYNPYLFYFFKSNNFRKQIKHGEANMINQITRYMLDDVVVNVPPKSKVKQIVTHLDSLSTNIKMLEEMQRKTLAECDALKQAMLREVFE